MLTLKREMLVSSKFIILTLHMQEEEAYSLFRCLFKIYDFEMSLNKLAAACGKMIFIFIS